ncbi:MAG: ATP-binding protein [Candidatus Latescibacteria bacterium]|nr:ATP-binding protein [Candidatus Latescibacterota bacterium]
MNDRQTIELSLPSSFGYEKVAMESAAAVAKMMGFTLDRIEDLKTAVGEACGNAIEHGNKQNASVKVLVVLTVEEAKLQIDVHDEGGGIKKKIKQPNIEEKLAGKDTTRGWGMFLIKSLMDEVTFETKPGNGNVTRMIIHLRTS